MPENKPLVFWEALVLLFSNPSLLLEKISLESGILRSFCAFFLSLSFFILVNLLSAALFNLFVNPVPLFESTEFLLANLIYLAVGVILIFSYSASVFIVMRGVGGSAGFSETFRVCSYGAIPLVLLSIIPVAGFIAGSVMSAVILTLGLRQLHSVSTIKTVFSVIIPIVIFILLIMFGAVPIYFGLSFRPF